MIRINEDVEPERQEADPWVVICADDDAATHRSTAFALDGELIEGRRVKILSAYSGAEAIEMVKNHPEVSALLLDVVMETLTAGLDAIAAIRAMRDRKALRIIVRSGAPGLMSELETVRKFDITDWRPKNELNQTRLLSAITLAVRANQELVRLDKRSAGLDEAMGFLERLAMDPSSDKLMSDLLGAVESSVDDSVWALAQGGSRAWRLACGPKASALDSGGPLGTGKLLGVHKQGSIIDWLVSEGRSPKDLGEVVVSGAVIKTSLWTSHPIERSLWDTEQNRALSRAVSSALAGQEKARRERSAMLVDSWTGLLSRQGLIEKLPEMLEEGVELGLFFIDLIDFARVNSALGHEAGDEIIRDAGRRVKSIAGGYPCARIGGDSFAVIMPKNDYAPSRLDAAFEEPMQTSIIPVPMRPRVSAALIRHGDKPSQWLTNAAVAMAEAKTMAISGGEPRWFDPSLEALALENMEISQKLFLALRDKKGMFMVFQPQINLMDGRVNGCEALIRWKDGDRFIPPDRFVPIAEHSGLAMEISEFALSESLKMMSHARSMGLELPRVSVNLSPVEFETGDLIARIKKHLKQSGCSPKDLMVEITETAATKDPENMAKTLSELRGFGVKVAIDDFGSGYSSLAQLARLPIDELKIDRVFVTALGQQGPFSGIAKMIVDLAASMQLEVVAEGVELQEEANILLSLGANSAQGWMYAKGLPEEEFFSWIKKKTEARPAQALPRAGGPVDAMGKQGAKKPR